MYSYIFQPQIMSFRKWYTRLKNIKKRKEKKKEFCTDVTSGL